MKRLQILAMAAALTGFSSLASAVVIDFKALADGSLGEGGYSTLMFKADGSHTTTASEAFLRITGIGHASNTSVFAYLDGGNAGLGLCGNLTGAAQCNPSSDDNVSGAWDLANRDFYNPFTPEILVFDFLSAVTITNVALNNNHDGDRSLSGDTVLAGVNGSLSSTGMTTTTSVGRGDYNLNLSGGLGNVGANDLFKLGYDTSSCATVNDCEFYVSKIEFSTLPEGGSVPEPTTLALLGLSLLGVSRGARRKAT